MHTSEKLSANEGPWETDDYDKTVFFTKSEAIDEEHIWPCFVLINPLENSLQIPKLLVLRLLFQQMVYVGFVVLPLDEHII
jgi:hypothetical protein